MTAVLGRAPLPRLDVLVRDIEAAIVSKDREQQSELVLRSAAALTRHWSRLPLANKPSFDGLLASLLDQVDVEARTTFARCLMPLRRAPRITTTRLACDTSLAVAAPLLEHCPSFDDEWLVHIIERTGREHRGAIARRRTIGPAVTAALITGKDPAVLAALLTNPGAAWFAEALDSLLPSAFDSLPLLVALGTRSDLSADGRASLAAFARQSALQALTQEGEFNREEADTLLEHVARSFCAVVCPERIARHAASVAAAGRDFGSKPAGSAKITGWLERRRLEDVLANLAKDVDLPVGILIACHDTTAPHALTIIMRGLGHPWSVLKALLQAATGEGLSPECLGIAHRLHFEVGPRTARMVARYAAIQAGTSAFLAAAASDDRRPLPSAAQA